MRKRGLELALQDGRQINQHAIELRFLKEGQLSLGR